MPRTRLEVAKTIGLAFLPAKRLIINATIASHELFAIVNEQRRQARLDPGEGTEILRHIQEAGRLAFEAQQHYESAHSLLAPYRDQWNVPPFDYGAEETPPNKPRADRQLSVVPTA